MKNHIFRFKKFFLFLSVVIFLSLNGCSKDEKKESKLASQPSLNLTAPGSGTINSIYIEAIGYGLTREQAIEEATQLAVSQVNGPSKAGAITGKSIKDYKIIEEKEVQRDALKGKGEILTKVDSYTSAKFTTSTDERVWSVKIGVNVLRYEGGIDTQKTKILIGNVKSKNNQFKLGSNILSINEIGSKLKEEINAQIVNSGRFFVVSSSNDVDIKNALNDIESGQTSKTDIQRLGNKLSADFILLTSIEQFEYLKHSQKFHLSEMETKSYTGVLKGKCFLVDMTTGQVLSTEIFNLDLSVEPSKLGYKDEIEVVDFALSQMAKKFSSSLMLKMFPITVISLEGNSAVLSQGGLSVKEGSKYKVVKLGEETFDPQTHESLGKIERAIGNITITSVSEKLSYGTLNLDAALKQNEFQPGLLKLRGELNTEPMSNKNSITDTTVGSNKKTSKVNKAETAKSNDDFLNDKDFLKK